MEKTKLTILNPTIKSTISEDEYKTSSYSMVYELTNSGDHDLVITNIICSCGCTVPSFTRQPIKPNETTFVKLGFNPKNKKGLNVKSCEIFANIPNSPAKLSFEVTVK